MRMLTIGENEAGQRLDRFLEKYMDQAPKSFFYKMLRKKNITLNGKKAEGKERLLPGDEVRLFLADETIDGFSAHSGKSGKEKAAELLPRALTPEILYEDGHVILFNKPAGLLSQKAEADDISLVEYLTSYLLESGQLTEKDLRSFRPGICSRLDRNTSGLVAAGKSLRGLQELNLLFRDRSLHKYYRSIAAGAVEKPVRAEGWLLKDERANQVRVFRERRGEARPICTEYRPLSVFTLGGRPYTYLEINLITGRSHQIRAHLSSLGHPLIGDGKYGDGRSNAFFRKEFGLTWQLLHAYRLEFPKLSGALSEISGKAFTAPLPPVFEEILQAAGAASR